MIIWYKISKDNLFFVKTNEFLHFFDFHQTKITRNSLKGQSFNNQTLLQDGKGVMNLTTHVWNKKIHFSIQT